MQPLGFCKAEISTLRRHIEQRWGERSSHSKKEKHMKGRGKMKHTNGNTTDEQVQLKILEGVLDRMDARGRKEPDPNSTDAQERADAQWLTEMRAAKAAYMRRQTLTGTLRRASS